MIADLHCHTTFSDGSFSPKELIKLAHKKNINAIAITDHDTIDGILEGKKYAKEYDIKFLNGIEFAASYEDREIHILGYNFDITEEFKTALKEIVIERENRNNKMIALLQNENIDITLDDLKAVAGGNIISRAHFANVLVDKNYVTHKDKAFKKYLDIGCKTYIPRKYISPKDCIDLLHKANGVAVLAHPTLYGLPFEKVKTLITYLKDLGLDGVEVKHSTYSYEQEAFLTNFTKKMNILQTGGSDFHGTFKKGLNLGTGYGKLHIPYKMYEDVISFK
ncbi:MAG: PHP domain-containing protein [Lachnospirales bacterium]